jgi:hypothetical protein
MFKMARINHTQNPAAPASSTQIVNELTKVNGSGAITIPKLGFFVGVAVATLQQKSRRGLCRCS